MKLRKGKYAEEQELSDAVSNTETLKTDIRLLLWENLFYQVVKRESARVAEAVVRILQGDNFITQYKAANGKGETSDYWDRLAVASLVIPTELIETRPEVLGKNVKTVDEYSRTLMRHKLESGIAAHQMSCYQTIVNELDCVLQVRLRLRTEKYQKNFAQYQADNPPATDGEAATSTTSFIFEEPNQFDSSLLKKYLSDKALEYLELTKSECVNTLEDIYDHARRTFEEASVRLVKHQPVRRNPVQYKGIVVPQRNTPMTNSFAFKAVPIIGKQGHYTIYATQYFEQPETKLKGLTVTIREGIEGKNIKETSYKTITDEQNYVTFQLFGKGLKVGDPNALFFVNAEFEGTNGSLKGAWSTESYSLGQVEIGLGLCDGIPGTPDYPMYGVTNLGIAEFKRVEQELCCYVEGEVSHIENVMAREYKSRSTRSLTRTELTIEETKEREVEDLKDTTTTDRHEMQTEISEIIQEDQSQNFGASAGVSGSYGSVNFNAGAAFNSASSSSASNGFNQAEFYAIEVTERAMKRIVEKTSRKRTSRMLREFEENNEHGYDNREGTNHVTGIYRWVDKIYKNKLMNYGKRLVYEFMVPEPAKNLKYQLTKDSNTGSVTPECPQEEPTLPTDPLELFPVIYNLDFLTKSNYGILAARYGAEVEPFPTEKVVVSRSFAETASTSGVVYGGTPPEDHNYNNEGAFQYDFELPEGYYCDRYDMNFSSFRAGSDTNSNMHSIVMIGPVSWEFDDEVRFRQPSYQFGFLNPGNGNRYNPEGRLPVSVRVKDIGAFHLNVVAHCKVKPEVVEAWRHKTFAALREAYLERVQEYNDYMAQKCAEEAQQNTTENTNDYRVNPLMARAIEKRELKRLALELIVESTTLSDIPNLGQNFYWLGSTTGSWHIARNANFENYTAHVKFLEEAFYWEIMAYTLYPYYWGKKHDWGEFLKTTSAADFIFQAFLQSGMGRMRVPVKAGYEKSVMFYLDTGIILRSLDIVSDGDDGLYQSIVKELELELDDDGNPVIEAEWKTRIPTSLIIIQKNSNPLDENGLPCACTENEQEPKPVIGNVKEGETQNELGVVIPESNIG